MKALVIDGYNAIHKIPYLKKLMDKDLAGARSEITRLAREYQRREGGIDKVCVVFDGQNKYRDISITSHSDQVFSRTGEGDREVVRMVSKLSKDYKVEVVSDDNYIRNNARAHNAHVIGLAKFVSKIFKENKKDPKKAHTHKITPDEAREINAELKKYWKVI